MKHPDADDLSSLLAGRLDPAAEAAVQAHLDGCEACQQSALNLPEDPFAAEVREVWGRFHRDQSGPPVGHRNDLSAPAGGIPQRLGDFRLVRVIGRGGMGVVYEAIQESLGRPVALKVLSPHAAHDPRYLPRFLREAHLAAGLHHTNIVPVFGVGEYEGTHYYVMQLIRGRGLDRVVRGDGAEPLDPAAVARVGLQAAEALAYAHSQGVLHRDIKPSNLLLDDAGSMWVADFGLAKGTSESDLTTPGDFLGTLRYMAPERFGGDSDARSDLYALGLTLHELLTGRAVYDEPDQQKLIRRILQEGPPPPRRLNPRVPHDLETVILKAMAREPAARYPTAAAFADDLRRFLADEPIAARPPSVWERTARFARRNKTVIVGFVGILASLAVGLIATLVFAVSEARQRSQADADKQAALFQAYRASLAAASAALQNHDVAGAARHLELAPEALRGWEWRHLHSRLDDSSSVVPFPAGGAGFLIAAPDSLRVGVVTTAGFRLTDLEGGEHGTLPISPERRRHVNVTQTSRGLRVAAWVGNTTFDLLGDAGEVLCRVTTPANEAPATVVVSPDGTKLCVTTDGERRQVAVFDATSGKQTAICQGHEDAIWTYTFSPDGTRLATGGEDRTARLWDAATGTLLATCRGHASKVLGSAFSADGSRLVTASSDGTVRQWDAGTGREVEPPYDRHSADVFSAVYSPDGQWVASAGDDHTIRVWRARGRQDVAVLHGHKGRVVDVAFAPGGRRLASLSSRSGLFAMGDDTARVWDVDPRATLPVLHGHTRAIHPIAYSPDGRWLVSGSWDNTARLWDATTGEPCATLPHPSFVWGLAFGPDGTWLVTGCPRDDRLRIWDVATARLRKEIPFPGKYFHSLTVSPDGTRLAATANDPKSKKRSLTVCDIASGESLFSTEGSSLAYSPDGRWLAALAADDQTVLLLDARTHETVARFGGHEDLVFKAAFSPDGRRLASCSRDHTVRLWQIDGGACQVLGGHTDEVYAVAFHPDGTRLATAGRDGAVWLWDLARGEEVVRLQGHKSFVWSLAFSPDGATLASGSGEAAVRLWDTAPLKTRHRARREAAALRPEAERLVEQLWREKNDPAGVAEALRSDRVPGEALRQAALRAVLRRAQPPEAAPDNPHDPP